MGFTLADAFVMLAAQDEQLKKDLAKSEGDTKSWAGKLGGTASKLLGGAVAGAGLAAVGAVAAVGVAALNASNDFKSAGNKMRAQLGLTEDQAEEFDDTLRDVFKNNFGDSTEDVAAGLVSVETAFQRIGGTIEDELQTATESAFALRDAFGVDVAESADAAATLLDKFALSSEQAFDLITSGYQGGLNASGDFLESIGEYSGLFAAAGFSAEQMYSILQSGAEGGVLGTDQIADAFKEFGIVMNEGTDGARAALDQLGLNYDDLAADVSAGNATWGDSMGPILDGLNAIPDPIKRGQVEVALFGTMAENLGAGFTAGLSVGTTAMEDMAGATDSLNKQYDSLGSFATGMWRRLVVAVTPVTDKVIDLANQAVPHVERAFTVFEDKILPAILGLGGVVNQVIPFVTGIFERFGGQVGGTIDTFGIFKTWIDDNMPLIRQTIETILTFIQNFWSAHGETIMTVVRNTFDTVKTIIDTVMRTVLDLITLAMQVITGDWDAAGQTLVRIVTRVWDAIKRIFRNQLSSLKTILNDFGSSMWNAGKALIESLWRGIRERFDGLLDSVRSRLRALRDLLPGSEPKDPTSPLRRLGDAGRAVIDNVRDGIESAAFDARDSVAALSPVAPAAGAASGAPTAANGPISITINLSSGDGGVGETVADGVMDALRRVGLA